MNVDDTPYEKINLSRSDDSFVVDEEKEEKKEKRNNEGGTVGKTITNLRKSIGNVTKKVIGKDADDKEDLNFKDLEVIKIEDSDDDEPIATRIPPVVLPQTERNQLAYFDYLSDEVIFNIFYRLPEKDMGRFSMSCKRLYNFMEEEGIWKNKADRWMNLRVSRRETQSNSSIRQYYVTKYNENERKEEEQRLERIRREKKQKLEDRITNTINFCDKVFFDYRFYEIPILLMILAWSILMALRSDEIILCSYHLVFIPLYFGYLYVGVSCTIAFIAFYLANQNAMYPTKKPNLLSFVADEIRLYGFPIVGLPWFVSGGFFVIYAFALESNGELAESFAFIPVGIVGGGAFLICFAVCAWETIRCKCSEDCGIAIFSSLVFWYFLWMFLFLALKNEFLLDINWGVCLVPIWLILSGVFIAYFIGSIFVLAEDNEVHLWAEVSLYFIPSFFGLVVWLILLCINLDALDRDLPIWPWVLTDLPIFVGLAAFTAGIGKLMQAVQN